MLVFFRWVCCFVSCFSRRVLVSLVCSLGPDSGWTGGVKRTKRRKETKNLRQHKCEPMSHVTQGCVEGGGERPLLPLQTFRTFTNPNSHVAQDTAQRQATVFHTSPLSWDCTALLTAPAQATDTSHLLKDATETTPKLKKYSARIWSFLSSLNLHITVFRHISSQVKAVLIFKGWTFNSRVNVFLRRSENEN